MSDTYVLGAMDMSIEDGFIVLTPSSPSGMLKLYLDPTKFTIPNVKLEVDVELIEHYSSQRVPSQMVTNREIKLPLELITDRSDAIILGNTDMVTGQPVRVIGKFRRIRL